MLSESQKDYVFQLAMEAAQHRAMSHASTDDAVDAAKAVVAAAKAASKALRTENTIEIEISVKAK